MSHNFERLNELKERQYELLYSESKRNFIQAQISKQELLINKLKVQCDMEQEDVDKLMKLTLTNIFHTILRNKEEQLDLERQQLLAATLKLQEAEQSLKDLKEQLWIQNNKEVELKQIEQEINELMIEKEAYLRICSEHASELLQIDDKLNKQKILVKELREALREGKAVLDSLTIASNSLDSAENWGNWDTWFNGGLISTHMKHSHIDDARNAIHAANFHLQRFQKELSDLNQSIDVQFQTEGFIKMMDYWFDGLIVDWIVQGRIKNSQEQTLKSLRDIRPIVNKIEAETDTAERILEELSVKKTYWIINSKLI